MFLGFKKLSLFFGSLLQALGMVLEVKWIHEGAVRTGPFCTAQGFTILSIVSMSWAENALCRNFVEPGAISSGNPNHREDSTRSTIPPTYHTDARGIADYHHLYF